MDYQAVRAFVIDVAKEVQTEIMTNHYERPHEEDTKRNKFDVVTDGDKAAEKIIVSRITAAYPDHHIVGEEGGSMGAPAEEAEYFWYLDPIDGTINFANNIPMFTTSIAMCDRDMRPLVGLVMNPVYDEIFSAAKGHGAFLNDKQIHVSNAAELDVSVISTGFATMGESAQLSMDQWIAFMPITRGIRRLGSIAQELAYVSCGRFDGAWEHDLQPWDVLAGLLLVQEAGGRITDYNDSEDNLYDGSQIVATNGHIHDKMLAVIDTTME